MTFEELITCLPHTARLASHLGQADLLASEILDLAYDSRQVQAGQAFFALPGRSQDANLFLPQAWQAGASLLLGEATLDRVSVLMTEAGIKDYNYLQVKSSRQALALSSAAFFGYPAQQLTLVGITGTKGKTSVAHLIAHGLNTLAAPCLLIGTTGIVFKDQCFATPNTTPESYLIHKYLAKALAQGASHVVMELSSQGLAMDRAYGLQLDLGIFLNLGRDHIGPKEHESWEDYRRSKAKIFSLSKKALINADDPHAAFMTQAAEDNLLCGADSRSDAQAEDPDSRAALLNQALYFYTSQPDLAAKSGQIYRATQLKQNGFALSFNFQGQTLNLHPGAHFLMENTLAALAALDILGFPATKTAQLLANYHTPGRLESLPNDLGATIVIDYAHNGLSLENLLSSLKALKPRRLLVLIGSVGGKSKERRKELAEVAEKYADWVYVSSDNPDFEDPNAIVAEIASHFSPDFKHYTLEADRATAIRLAIQDLKEGDCLALCGKGHENFQLIRGERVPLDEKAIVRAALEQK